MHFPVPGSELLLLLSSYIKYIEMGISGGLTLKIKPVLINPAYITTPYARAANPGFVPLAVNQFYLARFGIQF
ncbi:hypothetical protein D9M68_797610 [compost metagenome]